MGEQTVAAIIGTLVGGGIIIAAVIGVGFFAFREAISSAIKERLQKLDYSRGDTKLSLDLTSPHLIPPKELDAQSQVVAEQPVVVDKEQQLQVEQKASVENKTSTEWEKELFAELFSD